MAVDGALGYVKVAFSAASPVSWTEVKQILNADLPVETTDRVDTTVYSTARRKRSVPGMIETDSLKLKLLGDLDQSTAVGIVHEQLRTYRAAGTTIWWRYEVATDMDCTSFRATEFQGYVSSFSISAPMAGRVEIDVEIAFNGEDLYLYAAGASGIA